MQTGKKTKQLLKGRFIKSKLRVPLSTGEISKIIKRKYSSSRYILETEPTILKNLKKAQKEIKAGNFVKWKSKGAKKKTKRKAA